MASKEMNTRRVKSASRAQYGAEPPPSAPRTPSSRQTGGWRWKLGAAVLAGAAVWLYIGFRVQTVSVRGAEHLEAAHITEVARQASRANWLDTNLLSISRRRLESSIKAREPLVEHISLRRQWPHGLIVEVREASLGLIWQSRGVDWLVDAGGVVVGEVGVHNQGLSVIKINDKAGVPLKKGSRVAPRRFIEFADSIPGLLAAKTGLTASEYSVEQSISELYVATSSGYSLKLDTTRGAEEQLEALRVVLSELARQSKKPSEYVDLRVAGKVYYK